MEELERLKYPIGKFKIPDFISENELTNWINEIENFPEKLRSAVSNLTDQQLDTLYRPQGWTLRQVVHHLADSHMNAYVRFKLAITEDNPTIRPYNEGLWAECDDAKYGEIGVSLNLLDFLHQRWVNFLRSLEPQHLDRTYFHPVNQKTAKLKTIVGLYAWHGEHHLQHILTTRKSNKW